MARHIPDDVFTAIRLDPDPALIQYVQRDLEDGVIYKSGQLWTAYNGRRGYHGQARVFKYALLVAGMTAIPDSPDKVRKLPK